MLFLFYSFMVLTIKVPVKEANKIKNKLMNDKAYLLEILKKGSEKARIRAEENLKNIREKVGLI